MKIHLARPAFRAVTLTLETVDEYDQFRAILTHVTGKDTGKVFNHDLSIIAARLIAQLPDQSGCE